MNSFHRLIAVGGAFVTIVMLGLSGTVASAENNVRFEPTNGKKVSLIEKVQEANRHSSGCRD